MLSRQFLPGKGVKLLLGEQTGLRTRFLLQRLATELKTVHHHPKRPLASLLFSDQGHGVSIAVKTVAPSKGLAIGGHHPFVPSKGANHEEQ